MPTETEQPDGDPYAKENAELETLLDKHASILGEHFESVRIIAVRNRGDGCYARISRGTGNYFSQYGSIRDWLVESEQATKNQAE